jgi:ABC-type antimicrobial peptide transport system permease subunit
MAVGLASAYGLRRVISSLLFAVTPGDPSTYLGVVAFLAIVAALSCLIPARRATKVDPVTALSYE